LFGNCTSTINYKKGKYDSSNARREGCGARDTYGVDGASKGISFFMEETIKEDEINLNATSTYMVNRSYNFDTVTRKLCRYRCKELYSYCCKMI
jgi:hypothetical protein